MEDYPVIQSVEELHSELKKHIAENPDKWTTRQVPYGEKLITEGDAILKTFYIEEGIVIAKKLGELAHEDIVVNLFSNQNPCMPLSLYEGMTAEFNMVAIGETNLIHTIDIKTLRKAQKTNRALQEVLHFVIRQMFKDVFFLRDISAVKPFNKQFRAAVRKINCLANMQFADVLDFFRVDEKTLEKQLEETAKNPGWFNSIADIIAKKIEQIKKKP